MLGDLGADVIKIEKPGGEWMRVWGSLASTTVGEMGSFLAFNRNKRGVAVDLKDIAMRDLSAGTGLRCGRLVENSGWCKPRRHAARSLAALSHEQAIGT